MTSDLRKNCEHFQRCGKDGHYITEVKGRKQIVRCACWELEQNQRDLGYFFCTDPFEDTDLKGLTDQNLILEGTLGDVRRHVAGAILHLLRENRSWGQIDAQRCVEIWLGEDEELKTTAQHEWKDLVILLLGFGELKNKELPSCILKLLDRRRLLQKPTWVHMDFDFGQTAVKYKSELLARRLGEFRRVDL